MLLRNVGEFLTDNAALHHKRQYGAVSVRSQVLLETGSSMWALMNAAVNLWSLKRRGNSEKLLASREKERLQAEFSFKWKMRTVHTARLLNICCQ